MWIIPIERANIRYERPPPLVPGGLLPEVALKKSV